MTDDHESVIADAIDAAEDIRDPLEGLAKKTATDPGAPFSPETLEGLAALKKENRASFEALRARPHRPRRPPISRSSFLPMALRRKACGRSARVRTVRGAATAQPSAATR
jgi:hypothetical protein